MCPADIGGNLSGVLLVGIEKNQFRVYTKGQLFLRSYLVFP